MPTPQSTVTVTAGETAQITITLEAVGVPTTVAAEPGNATPVTTVTVVPTQGTGGGGAVPTNARHRVVAASFRRSRELRLAAHQR